MDPHFQEYLAAIAGMHDVYGEQTEDQPSEFHDQRAAVAIEPAAVTAA